MHEYSIIQALLERVDHETRSHGGVRVHRVRVAIGDLSGVEIDLLRTAFETIRHRTICEDADLEVRRVPARWECRACGTPVGAGAPLHCAGCAQPARLVAGDEIVLDQIEMEAPHV